MRFGGRGVELMQEGTLNFAKFPLLSLTLLRCFSLLKRKGAMKVPSAAKQGQPCCSGSADPRAGAVGWLGLSCQCNERGSKQDPSGNITSSVSVESAARKMYLSAPFPQRCFLVCDLLGTCFVGRVPSLPTKPPQTSVQDLPIAKL